MFRFINVLLINVVFLITIFSQSLIAEDSNIYEVLKLIQKDLKTLEKAVYSGNSLNNDIDLGSTKEFDQNSEDVLTRHLLKLTEIENESVPLAALASFLFFVVLKNKINFFKMLSISL